MFAARARVSGRWELARPLRGRPDSYVMGHETQLHQLYHLGIIVILAISVLASLCHGEGSADSDSSAVQCRDDKGGFIPNSCILLAILCIKHSLMAIGGTLSDGQQCSD